MKRQHPIEKMQSAFLRAHYKKGNVISDARILARHVRPLLDALWADHEVCREGVRLGDPDDCPTCKLIAEWRAKL